MITYDPKRPVLFLDVDGVLNAHDPIHPEILSGIFCRDKVRLLNDVVQYSNAQIVLSSAWRYIVHRGEMNLAGMSWLLRSNGVWNRLVGVTRPDTVIAKFVPQIERGSQLWEQFPTENERGNQIADWLSSNGHKGRYAVVDDLDLGIRAAGHPFVQTDGKRGLTDANVESLIQLLVLGPCRE